MGNVVFDRSGTLRKEVFFEFYVPFEDDLWGQACEPEEGDIVSRRDPSDSQLALAGKGGYIVAKIGKVAGHHPRYNCPLDLTHVTEEYWSRVEVPVWGGPFIAEFIDVANEGQRLIGVTDTFAAKLKASGLCGFHLEPFVTDEKQLRMENPEFVCPKLFELQFRGKKCFRPAKVSGAPNACPHCGLEPLICQECGFRNSPCVRCGGLGSISKKYHRGESDKRLISDENERWRPPIIEARKWDGSDFVFGGLMGPWSHVVTKRVVEWLLSVHAAPFVAKPILACVDGISEDTERKLAEAVRPPQPNAAKGSSK